jgi:DNA segregation ATPase FtsK/SpoIIIE-like protein
MTDYEKAIRIAKEDGKVSISYLQRRLCLSYYEAGRIIDQMKEDGYISDKKKIGIYFVFNV